MSYIVKLNLQKSTFYNYKKIEKLYGEYTKPRNILLVTIIYKSLSCILVLLNEKLKQNFTVLKKEGLKNKKMFKFKLFIYID